MGASGEGTMLYESVKRRLYDVIVNDVTYNIEDCYDMRVDIHTLANWSYKHQLLALLNKYYQLYTIQFNNSMYYLKLFFCDYPIIVTNKVFYKN